MNRFESLCGNIYRDVFYEHGVRYTDYFVDCAECSRQTALEDVGIGKRAKTAARERGWSLERESGKWLCPACVNAMAALSVRTDNVVSGLRGYGYLITVKALPGEEQAYYETLSEALQKVESTFQNLQQRITGRNKHARVLRQLHRNLKEPCWGVNAETRSR